MTGAPIPAGEDLVVIPVEQTDIPRGPGALPAQVTIRTADTTRDHIRRAGSDVGVGDVVAKQGTFIDAGTLAALVATGVREVEVYAKPRVAVITTGDELTAWPEQIQGARIPNSNAPMLAHVARGAGAADVTQFHTRDGVEEFTAALENAAETHDIVVTAGGISAGAFDVVRAATGHAKNMWFGSVAQRPGSPQGVGVIVDTPVLSLPGNPVAAFVSAHLYLVPLIRACAGRGPQPTFKVKPAPEFPAPHPRVTRVIPVRLDDSQVAHAFSQATGSHLVASLTGIDAVALMPPGARTPDMLDVILTRL